jgi:succinyl-CoA synthetase beta subunit
MSTFDQIVPTLAAIFRDQGAALNRLGPLVVNRDLNGRVRLIVGAAIKADAEAMFTLQAIVQQMVERLGPHAFAPDRAVLFEEQPESVPGGLPGFTLV